MVNQRNLVRTLGLGYVVSGPSCTAASPGRGRGAGRERMLTGLLMPPRRPRKGGGRRRERPDRRVDGNGMGTAGWDGNCRVGTAGWDGNGGWGSGWGGCGSGQAGTGWRRP